MTMKNSITSKTSPRAFFKRSLGLINPPTDSAPESAPRKDTSSQRSGDTA